MTIRSILASGAFVALGVLSSHAAQPPAPAPAPASNPVELTPPQPMSEVSPEKMMEVYGWILGQELQLNALGLSDAELAAWARGVASASKGEPPPNDIELVVGALQQFLQSRPADIKTQRTAAGRAEEADFLAKLDQNPNVKKTDSGLRYEILAPGGSEKPKLSDTVVANYTGTFVDGTVFDSTAEEGTPAEFQLMNVVRGWQEGLQLVGTGGRIKLYIPSELGYGEHGNRGIPPAKMLVFEVELVAVKPGSSPTNFGLPPTTP